MTFAVTGLAGVAENNDAVLTWDITPLATDYEVYEGLYNGFTPDTLNYSNLISREEDPYLRQLIGYSTTRYFAVRALDVRGTASDFVTVSVTTGTSPIAPGGTSSPAAASSIVILEYNLPPAAIQASGYHWQSFYDVYGADLATNRDPYLAGMGLSVDVDGKLFTVLEDGIYSFRLDVVTKASITPTTTKKDFYITSEGAGTGYLGYFGPGMSVPAGVGGTVYHESFSLTFTDTLVVGNTFKFASGGSAEDCLHYMAASVTRVR